MMEKLRSRSGRLFLLAVGILLTSTAGHAAARMMALQMAHADNSFAFQLAMLLTLLLAAAYVIATAAQPRAVTVGGNSHYRDGVDSPATQKTAESLRLSASQLMQLRLPPGMRLDSHDAIMIMTAGTDRRIVFVNPAFIRLTGYEGKDWVGQSGDLLQSEGLLRMESLLWLDTETDGSEAHWIARFHRRDGAPFCAEAHLHPVAPKSGAGSYQMVILTDVTSRIGKARAPAANETQALSGPSASL